MVMLCHPIEDAGEVLHLSCLWCGSSYNRSRNTLRSSGWWLSACSVATVLERGSEVNTTHVPRHLSNGTSLSVLHLRRYLQL